MPDALQLLMRCVNHSFCLCYQDRWFVRDSEAVSKAPFVFLRAQGPGITGGADYRFGQELDVRSVRICGCQSGSAKLICGLGGYDDSSLSGQIRERCSEELRNGRQLMLSHEGGDRAVGGLLSLFADRQERLLLSKGSRELPDSPPHIHPLGLGRSTSNLVLDDGVRIHGCLHVAGMRFEVLYGVTLKLGEPRHRVAIELLGCRERLSRGL